MPPVQEILSELTDQLTAVKPALDRRTVQPDSSLTADLGFDSLDLVELADRLQRSYGPVDLMPWLAQAMTAGGDRVISLAAYLHESSPALTVTEPR